MILRSIVLSFMMIALQTAWAGNIGLFGEWTETDYSEFQITHEYFTPDGVAPSSSGGYDMTGYIPVKEGDVIVISGDRSPGIPFMMGYTDNAGNGATILLGDFDVNNWDDIQVIGKEITIPADIAYVRCSARNTSVPGWAVRNLSVIKRTLTEEEHVVRILCVGNSFSADVVESYLYDMADASGIKLVIGNACRGGHGLRQQWLDIVDNISDTEYRKINYDRKYSITTGHSLYDILIDEPWDVITFQQHSQESGMYITFKPFLQNLINYVRNNATNPKAKLGFVMTWPYAQGYHSSGYQYYKENQEIMYDSILNVTEQAMLEHPDLTFLVPCGTAVQNLRSSFVGDNIDRDGSHLNMYIGRYTAAYTMFATIFGTEVAARSSFVPYCLNEFTTRVAQKAVLDAIESPYSLTPQTYPAYTGENTIVPADININFSPWGKSVLGWNDIGLHYAITAGLMDTDGNDSGILVKIFEEFSSGSDSGPTVTDTELNMPSSVSISALWGYNVGEITGQPHKDFAILSFQHLNKRLAYDFSFFGSRAYMTNNMETIYRLAGADTLAVSLNAANNTSSTVTIHDIRPDIDGTITLTVQAGPNNSNSYRFYYLNALRISPHSMDFTLKGDEQPTVGDSLCVCFGGDMSQYTFKWTRGDALGVFDDANVLSSTKDYVITENDYEHWLRVSVCDNAGNTLFTKDTWISKLPVLYIDTEGGQPITSKTTYVSANIRIQGNADYEQQFLGTTEIRGRGTTSWVRYPQKPYKLKLGNKTKLFGFSKGKHWVLISNFRDKTCLRNYTASQLARQLGILGMDMTWVDVVLNGEVKGCYVLSRHVRADKNSVDIFNWEEEAEDVADALFAAVKDAEALAETDKELLEESMVQNMAWVTDGLVTFKGKTYNLSDYGLKKEYDISKGYLFESTAKTDGVTHFMTSREMPIEVHAPDYLRTNSEMLSYVTNFWNDFETEYCQTPTVKGKDFAKYADMESMVAIWILNEIMGQGDLTNSRFSYIADDGKLHFGPAWDFDHAAASWTVSRSTKLFHTLVYELRYSCYRNWFPDPLLCQTAYEAYWGKARPFLTEYLSEGGELDSRYTYIVEAGRTNDLLYGEYPDYANPTEWPRTAEQDVNYFKAFLLGHLNWLDQQFASVRTLVEAMNKVCTYPCDPEIIEVGIQVPQESNIRTNARKVILDKHLYIIKDGETYSVDGKRIK